MGFRFQSNVIYLAAPVVRCGDLAGDSVLEWIQREWPWRLIRGRQVILVML